MGLSMENFYSEEKTKILIKSQNNNFYFFSSSNKDHPTISFFFLILCKRINPCQSIFAVFSSVYLL
jgi:hypothetical protein